MAAGPWRCSQCGTINEPVANSCRTCGRWPSLFDLEASVVDEAEVDEFRQSGFEPEATDPDPYRAETVEQEAFEPETFRSDTFEPETYRTDTFEPELVELPDDASVEPEAEAGGRRWVRYIVPLAVLVYIVLSNLFSSR